MIRIPDSPLAFALCRSSTATSKDYLSKSITYILLPNQIVPLLKKLISEEVNDCKEEETLFRGDSIATACFQVYESFCCEIPLESNGIVCN